MTLTFGLLIPIIIGIVQAIKKVGLDTRYAPILSVVLGIAGAYFFIGTDSSSIILGIVAGLTSCGLWSGTKATIK